MIPACPLAPALRAAAGDGADDVFLVGGYVRDLLLGRPAPDLDIAVREAPERVAKALGRRFSAPIFPLSETHGAWRVTLREPVEGIRWIDVAARRGEITADLALRDFTVNAIALRPEGGAPVDPFDGRGDLARRCIRLVADAAVRADPLRALRAVRQAVELGFSIDPATARTIRRDAALLDRAAGERRRDELLRAFATDDATTAVQLCDGLGLLSRLLPELDPGRDCTQPKEHYWDVFAHNVRTLASLDRILAADGDRVGENADRIAALWSLWSEVAPPRDAWTVDTGTGHTRGALLKLTGLLHDIGKPATKARQADGRIRFFGHDEVGADQAADALRRLRCAAKEVHYTESLIREHMRPGQLASPGQYPTARALYRLFRDLGDLTPDLFLLNLADGAAAAGPRQTDRQWIANAAYLGWVLRQAREREALVKPPRLVTGHDLMRDLGIAPGPDLGRILDALTEAQAAGEVTTRGEALALAAALAGGREVRNEG